VNDWVDFTSKTLMEGKSQEIPEPALRAILSMLFPVVAKDCISSNEIIKAVVTWTTVEVRLHSPVFEAIYTTYDQA